jgi:hypothetical protein
MKNEYMRNDNSESMRLKNQHNQYYVGFVLSINYLSIQHAIQYFIIVYGLNKFNHLANILSRFDI